MTNIYCLRRVLGAYTTSIPVLENEVQPPIELVLDKTVLDHQRRQQGTTAHGATDDRKYLQKDKEQPTAKAKTTPEYSRTTKSSAGTG